jgi:arylsulfatase A-like enzyme
VLFTSDHGCHFKTRNQEYKRSRHEASVRVPAALQGPGFDSGGQIRQLTSTIDLAPTLLDAAGIDVPALMQGRSVLPLVNKSATNWPDEVLIQISEAQVARAIRTARWKYGVGAPQRDGWDDSGSYRYVEEYLYDLLSDPYELANLAGFESHQRIAGELREQLIAAMVAAGEAAPVIEPAPLRPSGNRAEHPGGSPRNHKYAQLMAP